MEFSPAEKKRLFSALENLAIAIYGLRETQERILQRLDEHEREIGDRRDVAQILNIHPNTVEVRRAEWTEGVHHWKDGGRRLYALPLIRDLCINGVSSQAHQQAIIAWQQKILGAQVPQRKRGPKPGSRRRVG